MKTSDLLAVLLTALVGVAVIAFGAMGYVAFKNTKTGGAKSFGLLTMRTLRASTVLLVVYATTMLALADKLSQGAIAILAGIAGYVLGADRGSTKSPNEGEELSEN